MAGLDFSKIKAKLDAIPEQFANKEAKVGWFDSAKYEDGTPVAYVALIQEKGAPAAGVPARPFIQPTVDKKSHEWTKAIADGAKAVLAGRSTADDVLSVVGAVAAGDIQKQIASNAVEALSPTTVLLRKWRREGKVITGKTVGEAAAAVKADPSLINGVNADPLQDTGTLSDTITHQVGAPQ